MKVRDNASGIVFNVYAVYWKDAKTYFAYFPKKTTGLPVFGEEDVEIVDNALGPDFVYWDKALHGFYHRYLIEHKLLEPLFEHDGEAYKKFASLLGREP